MIKFKDGYKHVLAEQYEVQTEIFPEVDIVQNKWVQLSKTGKLVIAEGYAWDGPSGPTVDTKNFMRGSLIHDALFQLLREELLDQKFFTAANHELWKACREDGMSWFRAWYVYQGVERFGVQFAKPAKQNIKTAP